MMAPNLFLVMVVCWTISICRGFSIPSIQSTKGQSLIRPASSLSLFSRNAMSGSINARISKSALFSANTTTATVADPASTAASSSSSKPKPLSKNQEALSNRKFPRTWVPLASVFELDPNRPTPLEFLDQKFVCYKQTTDESIDDDWIVMDDVCPHRLVPLSEGRINRCGDEAAGNATTTVQCSYHGWEFDGSKDGACVNIPQATEDVAALAKASPRSSATTYSVQVHKNVLFFWPWADKDPLSLLEVYPKGHPEGIMASIAVLPPDALDDDSTTKTVSAPNTYTRDLPYGWDTLLENLIDPAHIPFAHHNLQGTREDAIPIQMTVPESLGEFSQNGNSGEAGFMFEWQDRTMGKHRAGTAEFQAPFGIAYDGKFYDDKDEVDALWGTHTGKKKQQMAGGANSKDDDGKRPFTLGVLCIPTKPGWSRAIIITGGKSKQIQARTEKLTQQLAGSSTSSESNAVVEATSEDESANPKKKKEKKSLMAKIFGIIPVWVIHLLSNKFLDSDLAFLHRQEQERLRYDGATGSSGSSAYYYMPAPADRCIAKLRQWFPKHTDYMGTKGGHSYSLPPPIADRSKLFDRYLQHTSHCKHCQEGLKFLRTKAKKIAWGGLFTSIVASHFLGKRLLGLAAKLVAVACLAAIRLTSSLEQAFLVGEFKHYENE